MLPILLMGLLIPAQLKAQPCLPTSYNPAGSSVALNAFYLEGFPLSTTTDYLGTYGSIVSMEIYSTTISPGSDVFATVYLDANNDGFFAPGEIQYSGSVTSNGTSGFANFLGLTLAINPIVPGPFKMLVTLDGNALVDPCASEVGVIFEGETFSNPGSPLGMVVLNDEGVQIDCVETVEQDMTGVSVNLAKSLTATVPSHFVQNGEVVSRIFMENPFPATNNLGQWFEYKNPSGSYHITGLGDFFRDDDLIFNGQVGSVVISPFYVPRFHNVDLFATRNVYVDANGDFFPVVLINGDTVDYVYTEYGVCSGDNNSQPWPEGYENSSNESGDSDDSDGRLAEQAQSSRFRLINQPVQDRISVAIEASLNGEVRFELLDLQGRVIETLFEGPANQVSANMHFSVAGLSKGMYLLRMHTATSQSVQKVLKR